MLMPGRPKSSAGLRRFAGLHSTGIQAQRARAEGGDLKQTTGNSDVLEEMDHLVLIREIAVKRQPGRQRKGRQDQGDDPCLISNHQQ
jgi:hypothetical protein